MAWPVAASAAPQIRVENAGIPSPQTPQITQALEFTKAENEDRLAAITSIAWSPDGKTGLGVRVPLVHLDADSGGSSDSAAGLGDIRARIQRSLRQSDDVLESTRWAVWGEIHLPTGDERALRSGETAFPRLLQPGMGAFGAGGGMAWTWIRDRHRFSATAGAHWMSEASGFQMGTEAQLGLSYWYRATPAVFDANANAHQLEVRPAIELLATHRFESEANGQGTGDDGALVWLAPGVQAYVADDLLLQLSIAVPLVNDINDPLGDREASIMASVRWYL